jgi:hypothetical protein
MMTMGTPAGPFFRGFVVKYIGITWIFWIYAIINFAQFLAYLAIGAETLYFPENDSKGGHGIEKSHHQSVGNTPN